VLGVGRDRRKREERGKMEREMVEECIKEAG